MYPQCESGVPTYDNNMQNQHYYGNQMVAVTNTSLNVVSGKEVVQEAGKAAKPKRVRTSFTSFQLNRLEEMFKKIPVISRSVRYKLSVDLNLNEKQIKIWFQNRRMKEKKENSKAQAAAKTTPSVAMTNRNIPAPPGAENQQVFGNVEVMSQNPSAYMNSPTMMMPPYHQYQMPQAYSSNTHYYQNNLIHPPVSSFNPISTPMDQMFELNPMQIPPTTTSMYKNVSAPLEDPSIVFNNNQLMPLSPSNTVPSNSPPSLDQNLGFEGNSLQVLSNSSSCLFNSDSQPSLIGYQNNVPAVPSTPSTSSFHSNSPPSLENGMTYQQLAAATTDSSPTMEENDVKPISEKHEFENIQTEIISPLFQTSNYNNEETIKQNISPMHDPPTEEQPFPPAINYYEIEQLLENPF